MAFARHNLPTPLPHAPHPRQLGLFTQSGLTEGAVEATQAAVRAVLGRSAPPTRFPDRPGCPHFCDCDTCLNGEVGG